MQVPPTFQPFQYWPGQATKQVTTFGGANQPDCFTEAVTAISDSYIYKSGGQTTIKAPGVLSNDITPWNCRPLGATPMTASLVTGPGSGTVSLAPDGSFNYTPSGTPNSDSFTYKMTCNGKVWLDGQPIRSLLLGFLLLAFHRILTQSCLHKTPRANPARQQASN